MKSIFSFLVFFVTIAGVYPVSKELNLTFIMCPDQRYCPDYTTCCVMTSGIYGCCPYSNAVCCSDYVHCCPEGFQCAISKGQCQRSIWSPLIRKKTAALS